MLDLGADNVTNSSTEPSKALASPIHTPETCVICLDRITENATALPCQHDKFDFVCLATWITHNQVCPLCKAKVQSIQYEHNTYHVPEVRSISPRPPHHRSPYRTRRTERRQIGPGGGPEDKALSFRRQVYLRQCYSLHVGTNAVSGYKNVTPASFDETTISRAKMFIRRELRVFEFLNMSPSPEDGGRYNGRGDRRASNAEYLLEYIVGILRCVDVKASGQAEDLLCEFLGRENARLFLHEVIAWLRSPFDRLDDWDRHVQYDFSRTIG